MNPERAIDLAIGNVAKEGLTDIFPRPFEVDLLRRPQFRAAVKAAVKNRIASGSFDGLRVRPIQHVLFPKKEAFDFRRAALMEPLDTIIFLALAVQLAPSIEKSQPKKQRQIVFSYRFKPRNGYLFDLRSNYTAFRNQVRRKCKQKKIKVLVKCDIASFYDRLNLHRLECSLVALGGDKKIISLVNQLLLFWANRDSYGLPVGSNASRILAEAALIPVDRFLLEHNVVFARFVDDYRLFAPDQEHAHLWLTILIERLQVEGLQINPAKTGLEDVSQSTKKETPAQGGDQDDGKPDA